jgi:hypothetical protein
MKLFNPMSVLKLLINMERHRLFSEDKKVSDIQFDIWFNNIQLPYVLSRIDISETFLSSENNLCLSMLINNFNTLIGLNNFIVIIDNKSNYFFGDSIILTDLDIQFFKSDYRR